LLESSLDHVFSTTLCDFSNFNPFIFFVFLASSVSGLPPVSGPTPPIESQNPVANIVGWVGVAICTMCMLLHLYSRRFITRTQDWNHGTIIAAVMLDMVSTALTSVAISGLGRYTVHVPLENVLPASYYGTILQPINIVSNWTR
jgi:hypothetical protein